MLDGVVDSLQYMGPTGLNNIESQLDTLATHSGTIYGLVIIQRFLNCYHIIMCWSMLCLLL